MIGGDDRRWSSPDLIGTEGCGGTCQQLNCQLYFQFVEGKLLFLYYCLFVVDSYVGLQEKNGPKSFQENLPKEQRQTMTLNFSAIYFCYQ